MKVFSQLSKIRAFEKAHLPYLLTLEDFDIVRIIGLHQERAEPLLLKQLYLEGLGKLRAGGIVLAEPYGADRRAVALILSPQVHKTYLRYGNLLGALKP